ncbi:MAG: septum site-determining protein MinC [Chloroflexi bacterium]|nr:septum site-determining protein MinC [Chloroflexota bacterium]MQC26851.1 septum site-determining protein MinC [Chloroflexota bacterium]
MPPDVHIKGIREGLLVSFDDGQWPELEVALINEIERQNDFLQGAKLILDVAQHEIGAADLGKLRDKFSDRGLSLWAILSTSEATRRTAQTLGFATRIHNIEGDGDLTEVSSEIEGSDATLIQRTLRSGSNLEHPGHVTVIGDVNPGAQIIAGGNVVVWGRLRGLVHAGAEGDEAAVVCALDLSPTQLRIAGYIAIPPEQRGEPKPEIAYVQDGKVLAEPWETVTHPSAQPV